MVNTSNTTPTQATIAAPVREPLPANTHQNPASAWPNNLTVSVAVQPGPWTHQVTVTATRPGGTR